MSVHRHLRFSLAALVLIAPVARAQGTPPAAAPPPPAAPAPAPAPPATPAPPGATPPSAGVPADAGPPQGGPVPYYQEAPAETPHIYVAQPPLPPIPPRNRYFHDGFYLRLAAGYGYLATSTSLDGNHSEASTSGSGAAFDLMIGATPAPGLVVGGALQLQAAFDPGTTLTQDPSVPVTGVDKGSSGSVGFGMIGPMIDAFPIPTGGFHLGGTLGLAEVGLRSYKNNLSGGFGAGIWTGYMWWASSQWSMGLMARFSLAWTTRKVGDEAQQFDASDLATALGIMLSAAYH